MCFAGYIHTSVNDGPKYLSLRCPIPSCGVVVDENMVLSLVSDEDKKNIHDTFSHHMLRTIERFDYFLGHLKEVKFV